MLLKKQYFCGITYEVNESADFSKEKSMKLFNSIKNFCRYNILLVVLVCITFTSVTATGFYFGSPIWRILPLWVSHVIMLMTTKANRYALLLGGLNSILYAAVYFHLTLYSSALYALLFSFPMQVISFVNWNKDAYKHSTVFKRLTSKGLSLVCLVCVAVWCFLTFAWPVVGSAFGFEASQYMYLDNATSILGIVSTVLCTLKYVDYPLFSIVSGIIGLFLNINVVMNDAAHTPYLIYGIYSLICVFKGYIYMIKLHREQQDSAENL